MRDYLFCFEITETAAVASYSQANRFIQALKELGCKFGTQTIAEFAENAEIIQMLASLGVEYAQGYGVAQPQCVVESAVA